jgi:hypothetical protein
MPKYRVLRRLDTGVTKTKDLFVYTVNLPKDEAASIPANVRADELGVPKSMELAGGARRAVQMQINRSGYIVLSPEDARPLLEWSALEPRNKGEAKLVRRVSVEPALPVAPEPPWVKKARARAAASV